MESERHVNKINESWSISRINPFSTSISHSEEIDNWIFKGRRRHQRLSKSIILELTHSQQCSDRKCSHKNVNCFGRIHIVVQSKCAYISLTCPLSNGRAMPTRNTHSFATNYVTNNFGMADELNGGLDGGRFASVSRVIIENSPPILLVSK